MVFRAVTQGAGGGGGGTPGGSDLQLQYNAAGSFAGMAGTSWDNTNRSLTLTGATVTTSKPIFDLSQTWNAAGVAFTGLKLNITNTASAAGALLLDLQVGGVSQFSVGKAGAVVGASLALGGATIGSHALAVTGTALLGSAILSGPAAGLQLGAADAAAPVAQTLSVQSVVTGTANTAGANFTIKGSAGTGSAAGGSIIFQTAAAGGAGSTPNTLAAALTLAGDKSATFTGAITTSSFVAGLYMQPNSGALNANAGVYFASNGQIQNTASGVFTFANFAGTDLARINLGGTTSSFPALKRSTTTLQVRLADDSAFAPFYAQVVVPSTTTVASLPTASSYTGALAYVNDATATTARSTVAGGGANKVIVFSDGTNWLIVA